MAPPGARWGPDRGNTEGECFLEVRVTLERTASRRWGWKGDIGDDREPRRQPGLGHACEAWRLYLSLVLGNVNVTLLSKQAKFAYKDEYEKFKLYLTIILILISFTCRFLLNSRVTDAAFNFLLVWYYCTLTIRESILINNGSRIKGWWVFHHYVSTFLSGVMLTWPDGLMYQKFRNQFLSFSMYQSFVQFLQYYYQSGCLYRLRALGERHTMDLTVEGFQSWMWRGLTFLLPFLFFGHFWQLFNALTLFNLARDPECKEWQVLMCGFPFLLLFLGNFFTTLRVVHQKFHNQLHGSKKE
ncbi:ion channel TACAN isoform X3 [Bos indicus]|uniref:Ion channel TACAN isoform X3 n=1 Tax=Bos indicus TaxID=9915 RepID=A0A6P5DY34_BOSIN|nr:PREDICTED: transmembrane protein 120A isoform X2 [Bos indicus]